MTANGSPADLLVEQAGASAGDRIEVRRGERMYEGVLMPRHSFSAPDTLVLKLDSGYNLGLRLSEDDEVTQLEARDPQEPVTPQLGDEVGDLPQVGLLGTGGTIASFVEYRTGAVYPATTPEELAAAVPEAFEHARLVPQVVFEAFSEDLTPAHWMKLADAIEAAFDDGARGVVVTHGTDTLGFTAAALSFLFTELAGPVVLVGAQRSSDRPSSDAATNLTSAVRVAAETEAGEVLVVMHEGMGDEAWTIHPAGRVRKMHTSRRDAFQSINERPLGRVTDEAIEWTREPLPAGESLVRTGTLSDEVGLVWSYPGLSEEELRAACRDGLVIAGTGLGHIPRRLIPVVEELVDEGALIAVASQCLNGRTNLRVYETGRELVRAGCLEAEDMLPETAYAKLCWALGTAEGDRERAMELFQATQARELAPRSSFHYPSTDGGER